MILYGLNISPYEQGNRFNTDPLRPKKLLLHKQEIRKLLGYITQKGLAKRDAAREMDRKMKERY